MALRIVGGLIALVGLVLSCAPTLVHDPGPAVDTYEAIERRVWYGAMTGLGVLLIVRTQLKPWKTTLAHVVLWIVGGFLLARVIGLVLDGMDSWLSWYFALWRRSTSARATQRIRMAKAATEALGSVSTAQRTSSGNISRCRALSAIKITRRSKPVSRSKSRSGPQPRKSRPRSVG